MQNSQLLWDNWYVLVNENIKLNLFALYLRIFEPKGGYDKRISQLVSVTKFVWFPNVDCIKLIQQILNKGSRGLTNFITWERNSKSCYTQAISKDYTLILSIYLRHVLSCALELWQYNKKKECKSGFHSNWTIRILHISGMF